VRGRCGQADLLLIVADKRKHGAQVEHSTSARQQANKLQLLLLSIPISTPSLIYATAFDPLESVSVTGMTEQKNQVTRAAPEQSNDYRVVVFGAGGVGKSSLVLRFIKGTFRESYIPTIEDTYRQVGGTPGARDYSHNPLVFAQVISCNKNICTLQITDTTGSHQFPAMQRLSISKGHAFILVYSVCSKQSLEELRPIWALIKELKVGPLPDNHFSCTNTLCVHRAPTFPTYP